MALLDKTPTEPARDVRKEGSRFYSCDVSTWRHEVFGADTTVGIVDENEGGIVAYCHEDNAERIIEAFRAFTGEV